MSYLQFPRLIFSGTFQADPPTVNNDPEHFNTAAFQPNYDLPGQGVANGWWNPKGSGAWRFKDCAVQQVQYNDGTSCDNSVIDPVVGMPINSVVDRVEGKLVDLDAEQEAVVDECETYEIPFPPGIFPLDFSWCASRGALVGVDC